jgi:ADP-ribosylglycohydrolase
MTPPVPADHPVRLDRVRLALDGLSVGDALGSEFFVPANRHRLFADPFDPPPGPWGYTDDTEMALAVADTLARNGRVDPDDLINGFARRYDARPDRGYGPGMIRLLSGVCRGEDYRRAARSLFSGTGSMGNGSAMRVAPVAGYFADDLDRVAAEAAGPAEVTHAHPDGVAGAVAAAVAGAYAWQSRERAGDPAVRAGLFAAVLDLTPEGDIRFGVAHASTVDLGLSVQSAASLLGNGSRVTCRDTVPFCLWAAARHLDDYPAAIETTIRAGGDIDTNCAIVGGIVGLAADVPGEWLGRREPLERG